MFVYITRSFLLLQAHVNCLWDKSLRPVPRYKIFRGLVAGTSCKDYSPLVCANLNLVWIFLLLTFFGFDQQVISKT